MFEFDVKHRVGADHSISISLISHILRHVVIIIGSELPPINVMK